jgi:hypothetical protein
MAASACSYASQPLGHAALGGTFSELLREQHMLKPSAPDHEVSERYLRSCNEPVKHAT